MKNLREQLITWKNEFSAGNFSNILHDYKSCVDENRWSLSEEVYAASYCVIALNAEIHKTSKPNIEDAGVAAVIFELVQAFCRSTSKSWDLVTVDFPAGVFYIFKYFLDRNYVNESLYIATQAFEYQIKHQAAGNTKNQPNVLYSMLSHLFNFTKKLQPTKEDCSKLNDLMLFLSANVGFEATRMKPPVYIKYFSSYFLKCARSCIQKCADQCVSVLKNLARSACHEDIKAEATFMEILRSLVHEICELSLSKQSNELLLYCMDAFEESCKTSSSCVSFCRNAFRIAVCSPEDKCLSDKVVRANYELQMLISNKSPFLKSAVYFSSVVIIKMRNWDSSECPFKKNCTIQLFELLYTLAEQLYEVNLNEFCEKQEVSRRDICSCVYLCSFLLCFAEKIVDLNLTIPDIYAYILKSVIFFRKCIENGQYMEKKKRQHMLYFIGVSCVNIYHKLAKDELQEKYIEICSIISPTFATLDAEDLSAPNFQTCLKKMITNLCASYRTTNSYIEALIASVVWSIILPNYSSTFMDIFGNLKQKLYMNAKSEYSFHQLNCIDLLKHEKNAWLYEPLNQVDAVNLLRSELEQYKKHNICSVKLAQNIIEAVRKLKPTVYQKSLLYMMIGEILSNTDSNENIEFLKKFVKSIDVLMNLLSKYAASPLESEITTLNALVGDLFYVKFRIELLIHRSENECELKSLSSFKKPASAEPGMEPDFKEEGNITLTNFVCLSAQRKLTKFLDSAVLNWKKGLVNKSKLDMSHLKDAALIYRLYCDTTKEVDLWKLLYSAATFAADSSMAVCAYANLLILPWNEDTEWRDNVTNKLLPQVPENIRLFYHLSYLNRRLVDGFDKNDEEALLSLSQDELMKHNLWANYCFLMSLCLQRNVVQSSRTPQLMSFLAYSSLMFRVKNKKWNSLGECCELQCLLFDVVLFLVSCNVQVYQVAEAKSYLKDPINLILKLSVPLRTSQYLNISIRIDTLTCSLDECYLKLRDVCDILEWKIDSQKMLGKPTQPAPVLSPVMDSDFRADGGGRRVEFPSLSHITPQLKFQPPDYMNHDQKCGCEFCTNHEYSRLLCEVTALFGVYYRLIGRGIDAVDFFEGALKMYDIVSERYSHVYQPLLVEFLKIKTFVMFEYANYRAMTDDFEAALALNAVALKCSRENGFPLRHDLMEQYWAINCARAMKVEKEMIVVRESEEPGTAAKSDHARLPPPSALLKSTVGTKTPAIRKTASARKTRMPQPLVFVDDEDDFKLHNKAAAASASAAITPYPRHSRRVLFGEFASPATKLTSKMRIEKKKTQMSTPPDIVMQTPSVIEKRTQKLGERKNLFAANEKNPPKLATSSTNPSKLAANSDRSSKDEETRVRRKPVVRGREKENMAAKK